MKWFAVVALGGLVGLVSVLGGYAIAWGLS